MKFKSLVFLLFILLANVALATATSPENTVAASNAASSAPSAFMRLVPLFFMITFIYYFMVLRPQEKELKAKNALFAELKNGDSVVLHSGVFGKVFDISSDVWSLEISPNIKIKITKDSVKAKV